MEIFLVGPACIVRELKSITVAWEGVFTNKLLAGVDFANSENGFVYHTKFDNGALVSLGSFQHTGDNVLALIETLANNPLLQTDANFSGGSMVYFDVLGLLFVSYSHTLGLILNFVISLLSLGTIFSLLYKIKKGNHIPTMLV